MQQIDATADEGGSVLRGRPSDTREEWEAARIADAFDLNRLHETGGEVEVYVVPLWSNLDAVRCVAELRGFDEARVYVELAEGEGQDEAIAAIAEAGWLGLAACDDALQSIAPLIHAAASLDVPIFLKGVPNALTALALAIGEDLTPGEIEAVLRSGWKGEPDAESLARARDLLASS